MIDFLNTALAFPTIFYSGLLAIVTIYWLFSIVGFLDIDMLDADVDIDVEADSNPSVFSNFLIKFKLDGVPVTLSLSFVILFSWIICFLVANYGISQIAEEWIRVILGLWAIILAPFVTAPLVAIIIAPLKPLFKKQEEQSSKDIIGRTAKVRSSKVTANFGEAELHDGGAGLILKIRAKEPNKLQRGDQVLLQKYNVTDNTYSVKEPQIKS